MLRELFERPKEGGLEVVVAGRPLHDLEAERVGLCRDQAAAYAVEPHAPAGPVVEVEKVAHR